MIDPIGPYRIVREVARGGMGVVYHGRDDDLGRDVAIKVLGPHADPSDAERFEREATAAARVHHPHLVSVHSFGSDDQGSPYLVMDMVRGSSLTERIAAGGRLEQREAVALLEPIARALHALHEAGVLHRDVKPANILLGEDGRALLADFGIAKEFDAASVGLTKTGELLGTPTHMAPEQVRGDKARQGPATDVYGLGATLYQALTGRAPFGGSSVVNVLDAVINSTAAPPIELVADLHPALDAICLRCLEKDPALRYPSAEELADDLARYLSGETVSSGGGPGERAVAWCRDNAAVALAGGIASLLLIGTGVAVSNSPAAGPTPVASSPELEVSQAPRAPDTPGSSKTAGALRRPLLEMLASSQLPETWRVAKSDRERVRAEKSLELAEHNLAAQDPHALVVPYASSILHYEIAKLLLKLGRTSEALAKADEAIALETRGGSWQTHLTRAVALARLGRLEEALVVLKRITDPETDLLIESDEGDIHIPWAYRAMVEEARGAHEESFRCWQRAIESQPNMQEWWARRGLLRASRGDELTARSDLWVGLLLPGASPKEVFHAALRPLSPAKPREQFGPGGGEPSSLTVGVVHRIADTPQELAEEISNAGITVRKLEETGSRAGRAESARPEDFAKRRTVGNLWYRIASAHLKLATPDSMRRDEHLREGFAALDAAIRALPTHPKYWVRKANALHDIGERDEALALMDLAVCINQARPSFETGDTLRRRMLEQRPRYLRAFYLAERGQTTAALEDLDWLAGEKEVRSEALALRGLLLEELGNPEKARLQYERAMALADRDREHVAKRLARGLKAALEADERLTKGLLEVTLLETNMGENIPVRVLIGRKIKRLGD